MSFEIEVKQMTVYTCADGQTFQTMEEAKRHNTALLNRAKEEKLQKRLEETVESYLNSNPDWSSRKCSQVSATLTPFFKWYQRWNREFVEPQVRNEVEDMGSIESIPSAKAETKDEIIGIPF